MASLARPAMKSVLEETFGGSWAIRIVELLYGMRVQQEAQTANVDGAKGVARQVTSRKSHRWRDSMNWNNFIGKSSSTCTAVSPSCVLRTHTPSSTPGSLKAFQRFNKGYLWQKLVTTSRKWLQANMYGRRYQIYSPVTGILINTNVWLYVDRRDNWSSCKVVLEECKEMEHTRESSCGGRGLGQGA